MIRSNDSTETIYLNEATILAELTCAVVVSSSAPYKLLTFLFLRSIITVVVIVPAVVIFFVFGKTKN